MAAQQIFWINPASGNYLSADVPDNTGIAFSLDYDNTVYLGSSGTFIWFGLPVVAPTDAVARAHYQRALMDGQGNVLFGSSIRLIDPVDGATTISDTVFSDAILDTTRANPWVTENGVVDFYLAAPRRVRIGITRPGDVSEFYIDNVDLFTPPAGSPTT